MHFLHHTIRLLSPSDLHAYYDLVQRNRPRLEAFFTGTVSKTATLEDTRTFLADMLQRAAARTYFPYIIVDNNSQQIVGFLDLKNIDWSIPKSEIGCYIDEASAGKGITTQAVRLFCDHCFAEYGFQKLFLRTHQSNSAARRVAESCGFVVEGILRRDYKTTAGELVDLVYYGRLQ